MRSWLIAVLIVGCGGDNSAPSDGPSIDAPPMAPHTHTLYLNFEGVTLAAGSADDATQNQSALVDSGSTLTLPSYLGSGSDRSTQISNIAAEVTSILAPYDIDVVTARPSAGSYVMIVTSDASGETLGCTGECRADAPADCGSVESPIAFNFGSGSAINVHQLTTDTVAMLGLTVLGVPESAVPNDCMCFSDSHCIFPPSAQCTIGGAGTAISANKPGCATSQTVMNENALFLAGFGAHP